MPCITKILICPRAISEKRRGGCAVIDVRGASKRKRRQDPVTFWDKNPFQAHPYTQKPLMADSNQAGAADGSALSRSTSVTKSGRTTHQRKPSLNISSSQQQPPLYAVPEKPASTPTIDPASSMPSPKRLTRPPVWRSWLGQLDALFDSPAGPLLPHDKHSTVFGGTHKRSKLTALAKPRWVRFLILFYIVFSVFLSINHLWHFFTSPSPRLDSRFGENWKPQRTYDQDAPYSSLDSMTHGLKMSKLFSKAFYEAAGATRPYWLKGSQAVQENDVTVITTVTPETWPELERLAKYWHGMEEKKIGRTLSSG